MNDQRIIQKNANVQNDYVVNQVDEINQEQEHKDRSVQLLEDSNEARKQLLNNKRTFFSDSKYMKAVKNAIGVLNGLLECIVPTDSQERLERHISEISMRYEDLIVACNSYLTYYEDKKNLRMTLTRKIRDNALNEKRMIRHAFDRWSLLGDRNQEVTAMGVVRAAYGNEINDTDFQVTDIDAGTSKETIRNVKGHCAMSRLSALFGVSSIYRSNAIVAAADEKGAPVKMITRKIPGYVRLDELLRDNIGDNRAIMSYDFNTHKNSGKKIIEYAPSAIIQLQIMRTVDTLAGINSRRSDEFFVKTKEEGGIITITDVIARNKKKSFAKRPTVGLGFKPPISPEDVKIDGDTINARIVAAMIQLSENPVLLKYCFGDLLDRDQIDDVTERIDILLKKIENKEIKVNSEMAEQIEASERASGSLDEENAEKGLRSRSDSYVIETLCTKERGKSAKRTEKIRLQKKQQIADNAKPFDERGELVVPRNLGSARGPAHFDRRSVQNNIYEKEWHKASEGGIIRKNAKKMKEAGYIAGDGVTEGTYSLSFDYVDIKDEPLFEKYPSILDIKQGGIGDCYFLASVTAILNKDPSIICKMMRENDDKSVTVRFFDRERKPVYITVDKTIINYELKRADQNTIARRNGALGALWVNILEKAFAMFRRDNEGMSDYLAEKFDGFDEGNFFVISSFGSQVISGGQEKNALMMLTGDLRTTGKSIGKARRVSKLREEAIRSDNVPDDDFVLGQLVNSIAGNLNAGPAENLVRQIIESRLADRIRVYEKKMEVPLRADDIIDDIRDIRSWGVYDYAELKAFRTKNGVKESDVDAAIEKAISNAHTFFTTSNANICWEYRGKNPDVSNAGPDSEIRYTKRAEKIFAKIKDAVNKGKAVTVGTRPSDSEKKGKGLNNEVMEGGMALGHAYAVLDICEEDGRKLVVLHNPWGGNKNPEYSKVTDAKGKETTVLKNFREKDGNGTEIEKNGILVLDVNDLAYFINVISTV